MKELLESGVHFGHQTRRWNPKMKRFIYGARNGIYIIDLHQTIKLFEDALNYVKKVVEDGGTVLFVGTKKQAQAAVKEAAERSGQYYISERWLGGTLTNWKTISGSIQRLRKVDEILAGGAQGLTKKERLMLAREKDKLERALGGIKDMGGTPDLIFVIDTNKEALAIKEAQRLGIPVAAIIDTNSDPDGITYPIPGNDDAGRAIALYCDLISRAAIDGISRGQGSSGVDVGAFEAPVAEVLPVEEGLPAGEAFEVLDAPRGAPDDLSKLAGSGPQIVKKLNDAGVFHYWQVAAMTPEDVTKLDADLKFNGRIERDGWVNQARSLLA